MLLLLLLLAATILGWGGWHYWQAYDWLEQRHIEGLLLMVLLSFGLTAVFVSVIVWKDRETSTAQEVAQHYLAAFGLMFVALTAVFTLLWLLGWLWLLFISTPWLLITAVLLILITALIQASRK